MGTANKRSASSPSSKDRSRADRSGWIAGGGEMGELIRSMDWSQTPIGPMESWSPTLRMMVRFLLANRFPTLLWWGPDYVSIYNDPYRPVLGTKHPWALGTPVRECWSEIWHILQPLIDTPFHGGPATWNDDIFLELNRHGFVEETHFTIAYSPVPDDTVPSGIGGVLATVNEITDKVIAERRVVALRDLGARVGDAKTAEEACAIAADTLSLHDKDIPFALLYLADTGGTILRLAGAAGAEAGMDISPHVINLDETAFSGWPLIDALQGTNVQVVDRLQERFDIVPRGPWSDPPTTGIAVIIPSNTPGKPAGLLMAGVSPRLKLDDYYLAFFELVRTQVATAIANARAYEEERRRAEMLAELDRAKTAFFSNVSHEFRTPLTLILGPLEDAITGDGPGDAESRREHIRIAHRNALRLQRLVNTLLDFSRIEAGRVDASYEAVDLAVFTSELASSFRAACEKAGLDLVVDCAPLADPVWVDRDMWEKIVLNLISNAFKFTLEGRIEITLRDCTDHVELSVRDTGTGIPDRDMPRLFERFHRIEGVHGRTMEGSGIGLALVRELVKLHGGDIRVQSAPGAGSVFTVSLPSGTDHLPPDRLNATPASSSASPRASAYVEEALRWLPDSATAAGHDADPSPAPLGAATALTTGPRPRILVVDDNADLRDYLVRLLSERYTVTTAVDGRAAFASAFDSPPDLIISDVMMPVVDGFGMLQRLRNDPRTREVPVILLSARAGEESRIEGLQAGADDYLIKPFSARELLARVQGQLQLAELRDESRRALRDSEERFRNMADTAPAMLWVTEPDVSCSFLSQSWYEYTGQTEDDGLGFGWFQAVHPDDALEAERVYLDAFEKRAPFLLEYRLRRHDGEYRWVQDTGRPRFDAEGAFLGYIGSVFDVHESRIAEELVRESDRRKDEFLAMLSHELRNPLAPIRNAVRLLEQSDLSASDLRWTRNVINRQTEHLARLVDDLLDVSRITRGKIELRREILDLRTIVDDAVELARPLVDERNHTLQVDFPDEPIALDADRTRLSQVLSNLLNNAAKYTEPGGTIRLSASREGDDAVIRVRDNGVGIPSKLIPHIFEMFMQVDRTIDRSQGGLGIGLTLVQRLVRMHGGTVDAHSDGSGTGAEFTIRLPAVKRNIAGERVTSKPQPDTTRVSLRILVVDDNRDSADSMALLLETLGHEVRTAHDGLMAVDQERSFHPHVVLLDIGLPKLNGYEAARRIREQGSRANLIALTGWGKEEDRLHTREAGFDHHLTKPVVVEELQKLFAGCGAAEQDALRSTTGLADAQR